MSIEYHLKDVEQGTTYHKKFIIKNKSLRYPYPFILANLTGFTARMKVRSIEEPTKNVLSLTTENGGVVISLNESSISLYIPASKTALFSMKKHYHYDLELVKYYSNLPESEVFKLIHGRVLIRLEEVTY